ncbi:unnamed protein product [Angiostrongylus costaricensis]|uniref:Secreted protein n=1 Tax=Angiostrongylus costaricensis TaxID=334426 RepID=A0A0R3PYY0_ANGCS|nr:unnamed protein product [Angiostrongylus costaricensis]
MFLGVVLRYTERRFVPLFFLLIRCENYRNNCYNRRLTDWTYYRSGVLSSIGTLCSTYSVH